MSVREGTRWIAVAGRLSLCLYLGLPGKLYDGDALKQAIWNYDRPLIGVVNHPYSQAWFYAWWRWVSPVAGRGF